jgi:hypothetical protein
MLPKEFDLNGLQNEENRLMLKSLILQLKKDALMSGLQFELNEESSVESLIHFLNNFVFNLIQKDFSSYASFLYRVDVNEKDISGLHEISMDILVQKISELILKKEWRKIWFRSRNQ